MKKFWKIIFIIIVVNIIAVAACIIGSLIYKNVHITNFSDMLSDTMNSNLGYALCNFITSIFIYSFFRCIIKKEKITFEDLGFSKERKISQVMKGFLFGLVFVVIYISVLIAMKDVDFRYNSLNINAVYSLLMGLIIFGGVAFAEEITYRGYIQYILSKKNEYVGLVISAIVFALSHLVNASYSPLSLIYLSLAGLMFGLMRMKAKNIWVPFGAHIAWNWTETRVFGLNNKSQNHWLSTNIVQNTIWNGGESGSGIVIVAVEIVFIAILAYLYLKGKSRKTIL